MKLSRLWLGLRAGLAALGAAALLGACSVAEFRPVGAEDTPAQGDGTGYVLASVTLGGGRNALFRLRAIDGTKGHTLHALAEGVVDFHDDFDEDDAVRGRVTLIELPAGHYELTNWALLLGTRSHERQWLRPAALPAIPFTVRAAEVVYLGNLHVAVTTRDDTELVPRELRPILSAGARIEDRSARDLAIYRARYPGFVDVPLRASVKTRPEWELRISRHRG